MDRLQFEQVCRDASLDLGLPETDWLGRGFTVLFEGLPFEALYREGRDGFVLMMEGGQVAEEKKAAVYRNLLSLQIVTWNLPGLRFGFNPKRGTILQFIDVKFDPQIDGAWLAGLVRMLASRAPQLHTLLDDEALAQDGEGPADGPMASQLERQVV
jgi:hypothetical protein